MHSSINSPLSIPQGIPLHNANSPIDHNGKLITQKSYIIDV